MEEIIFETHYIKHENIIKNGILYDYELENGWLLRREDWNDNMHCYLECYNIQNNEYIADRFVAIYEKGKIIKFEQRF